MSKKEKPKPTKVAQVLRPDLIKGGRPVTSRDVPSAHSDMQPGKDYETR